MPVSSVNMKVWVTLLLASFVVSKVDCSVANHLADGALTIVTSWMKSDGPRWFTIPGLYFQGAVVNGTSPDEKYTVSLAGPIISHATSVTRDGEATMTDDPDYPGTVQYLNVPVSIKDVFMSYGKLSYNDDKVGFQKATAMAITNGLTANMTIQLSGTGDTCSGILWEPSVGYDSAALAVFVVGSGVDAISDAVSTHFAGHVPNAIAMYLSTGATIGWKNYDFCSGKTVNDDSANVMADNIIQEILSGSKVNVGNWTGVAGFWVDKTVNDQLVYRIAVPPGNFSEIGQITRVGDASFQPSQQPGTVSLNWNVNVDFLAVSFSNIVYIGDMDKYIIQETIKSTKASFGLSVTYFPAPDSRQPQCATQSYGVSVNFAAGPLQFQTNTTNVPSATMDEINKAITSDLNDVIEGGAEDLFLAALQYAISQLCLK